MGVFGRLGTLIKSNINDLISKAEEPEKILNQLIVDMREQLVEAKKQVAVSIADEKRVKKQLDNQQHLTREWEKKAMMAVRAGRDDLAMEALQKKEEYSALAAEYRTQHEAQKAAADQLRASLKQLHSKIEEAKRKKDLLIARKRRVEAQQKIQDTMAGFGDTSAFEQFEKMAQKVENMEAEAEATAELNADMAETSLDDKFRELEVDHGASEALMSLKAKMGIVEAVEEEEEEEEFDIEALERELATVAAPASFQKDDF
ncbi:MAG: phage shock protein A [Bradymonadia bacterium]|jgi:phage shock protein A